MRYAPLVVLMLGWAHPSAQVLTSQPASLPRFEVASVKPSGKFRNSAPSTPTRLVLSQVTVRNLIQVAYRLPLPQIEGGAPWIDSERFDVEATTAVPTTTSEKDVLLQRLLADRFAFRMHFDTRPQPAYALVLSRADRRLGPNLTQSKFDCAAHRAAGGAPDLIPKRPDGLPICAAGIRPVADGVTRMEVGGVTMSEFARALAPLVTPRVVVDRTGLPGTFDVDMTFANQQALTRSDGILEHASLSTSVGEQLGLKLEPITAPVDVLVIDRLERPTPD